MSRMGIWHISIALSSLLIEAGTYLLIVRRLGPQALGTFALVQSLVTIALPVLGTGMSTLANRQIASMQSRQTPRLMAGIFYFLWYRQCHTMLLYCPLYLLLAFPLSWIFNTCPPSLLLLAMLSTLPILFSNIAGITLRSLRRSDLLLLLHLFGALLAFLFTIIAAQIHVRQIEFFLLASTLSGTLTLTMALICLHRLLPLREARMPGSSLKQLLNRGLRCSPLLFAIDLVVWQRGSLLLFIYQRSHSEAGFFAISAFISTSIMHIAPRILSSKFSKLLMLYLPSYPHHNNYDAFLKMSCYLALLTIPICLLVMALSPTIIMYSFGIAYLPLVTPLRILLVAAAIGSIATASSTHLARYEDTNKQKWSGIGAALLQIALAWPCITLWGATGAAIACTIAQVASALGSILMCQQLLYGYKSPMIHGETL